MDLTIYPHLLAGNVKIIPSKSIAHRMLICAAFADGATDILCASLNDDISATMDCLRSLGADIRYSSGSIHVSPSRCVPQRAALLCRESASTLRFLLPVVGALGVDAEFIMDGKLPQRPLSPLWEELERNGCLLSRPAHNIIRCQGKLCKGCYSIDGSVSSQYITGLMLGLSLMDSPCEISITGKVESAPYIEITRNVLKRFGVDGNLFGGHQLRSPGILEVEGDWSNGAFFLAANALGSSCFIEGLSPNSIQGDRAVSDILENLKLQHTIVDGSNIPDLIPVLAVAAAFFHGAEFRNIGRLRLKESDRIQGVCNMLAALGIRCEWDEKVLRVYPGRITGGSVNTMNDHRIAMAAAVAATIAAGNVTILGAECVKKSYPDFWAAYARLGGIYEKHMG